ncbi:hypothetical protein PEBR_00838 [Penicillium brasilianum]|uniref:Nephrocystin 3-like N-terminal domain-containing protein n=1 Tax=Penicillium brasilianum TaxID=104259 RepID=A0A1S9S0Z4_PENBI|nr:hypothetical protein PEBR_00838 [Penicillium brasilianum]
MLSPTLAPEFYSSPSGIDFPPATTYDYIGNSRTARILAPAVGVAGDWGYDADIEKFMSSAGQNSLHWHGLNLLNDLADLRDSVERLGPFIFVAHSLGGLVVKDALNKSAEAVTKRSKDILPATCGICFLGTPHRGSKSASMGRWAFRLTEILGGQRANTKLIRALERNSESLERISDSFYKTLKKRKDLRICSFVEEKEVRKLGLIGMRIVPPDSATIGYVEEETRTIAENHSDMAKFASESEPGFKRVTGLLKRWVREVEISSVVDASEDYQDCLSSLDNQAARMRIEQVKVRHDHTFEWLYESETVQFRHWLQTDSRETPIFWISGKPGSGKSTLMRFAMQDPRTGRYLQHNSDPSIQWTCIGFFFHDRGSDIQKSLRGMLQELVFQLLRTYPHLFQSIQAEYRGLVKEQRVRIPSWDESLLEICFRKFFNSADSVSTSMPLQTCLFIDALDEHVGDNERLLSLLADVTRSPSNGVKSSHKVRIKVCLASRPWPLFKNRLAECPQFAIHEHTQADIENYTKELLQTAGQSPGNVFFTEDLPNSSMDIGTDGHVQSLVKSIIEKALGVFIWVRIVVDEISAGIANGTPFFALEEIIHSMPQELGELYARTLQKIEPKYVLEAHIMLRVALCALSPIPIRVFRAIAVTAIYERHEENMPLKSLSAWLTSRTGGLLECVSSVAEQVPQDMPSPKAPTSRSKPGETIVQFIHQTVRDHLLTEFTGLNYAEGRRHAIEAVLDSKVDRVDQLLAMTGNAHILLFCQKIKSLFPEILAIRDDFMRYAALVDTEIDEGKSEREYLPAHLWWSQENAQFWLTETFPYKEEIMKEKSFSTALYVAVIGNLHNRLEGFSSGEMENLKKDAKAVPHKLLPIAALGARLFNERDDRPRMVKNVLELGCDPNELWTLSSLSLDKFWPEVRVRGGGASQSRNTVENLMQVLYHPTIDDGKLLSILSLFLEHKAAIPPGALISCALERPITWVELLLSHGARWPISLRDHERMLHQAQRSIRGKLCSEWYQTFWAGMDAQGIEFTSKNAALDDRLPVDVPIQRYDSDEFISRLAVCVTGSVSFPYISTLMFGDNVPNLMFGALD